MALALSTIVFTTTTRDALRDALETLINSGTTPVLELYTSTTPGGGTLLAAIPLNATDAVTASSPGLLTFVVPQTVNGAATGTPGSWQLKIQSGGTVIAEGLTSGSDTINSGQPVNLTSWTITISA